MNIGESIFTCFRKYAVFRGRATRSEYWWFWLFTFLVSFVLVTVDDLISNEFILSDIFSLVTLLPSLAVGVRRMHDTGHSGWFLLVPIYNLILACTSSDGPNRFDEGE